MISSVSVSRTCGIVKLASDGHDAAAPSAAALMELPAARANIHAQNR
jgi:hypothetical protein